MIKGILFDMDGVLIDSETLTTEAAIIFFKRKGFDVKHEDFYPFYGTGEKGYFMGVAGKYNIPFDLEKDKIEIYNIFKELATGKDLSIQGVFEFINQCKNRNLPMAVATSAGKYKLNINLQLLGLQNGVFDALISGEDIQNNKPDPEIFIKAAEQLKLSPSDCLVIEDAPNGVKAAKAAGCKCMALRTTFDTADLKDADIVFNNFEEIPQNYLWRRF